MTDLQIQMVQHETSYDNQNTTLTLRPSYHLNKYFEVFEVLPEEPEKIL